MEDDAESRIQTAIIEVISAGGAQRCITMEFSSAETTVTIDFDRKKLNILWYITDDMIEPIGTIVPEETETANAIDDQRVSDGSDRLNAIPTSADRLGEDVCDATNIIRSIIDNITGTHPLQFHVSSVSEKSNGFDLSLSTSVKLSEKSLHSPE